GSTNGTEGNVSAPNAGAVYIFTRSGMAWSRDDYLKASNIGGGDNFGAAVSLSGDGSTLAVGATGEDSDTFGTVSSPNDDISASGAVYVFSHSGTWAQQAYVKASNTEADDNFGAAVSLSDDGNTLAVGANLEDSDAIGIGGAETNSATQYGAVYIFNRSGIWSQQAYVKASNTGAGDEFGIAVSLSDDGNTLAVGANLEDSDATGIDGADNNLATDSGAVYLY
ncbi:MAG: integrin, partial [Gammaproteobacteria bacterium]|nr:integrin [Gammaproteobacteria bacterium]